MDHLGRIYALHNKLRRSHYPVSTGELCEALDCSRATLRRLVQQMRDQAHAPIETSHHEGGGYWYRKEERERYELPGVWFNPSELLALVACLELLHRIEPGVLEPQIAPLRERIEKLLADHNPGAAGEFARIRILGIARRLARPEVFRVLAEAVLTRHRLSFGYHARANDKSSQRMASPQRLTHYRDNWYLDAWDHERDALRIFSVDRIESPHLLAEVAEGIPEAQLDGELAGAYGIFAGKPKHTALLRFTAERARWVAEEEWHPKQEGRFLEDGRYELRIPYADPTELVMDILKYGPDVEVLAPAALRRKVAGCLAAAARQYSDGERSAENDSST